MTYLHSVKLFFYFDFDRNDHDHFDHFDRNYLKQSKIK